MDSSKEFKQEPSSNVVLDVTEDSISAPNNGILDERHDSHSQLPTQKSMKEDIAYDFDWMEEDGETPRNKQQPVYNYLKRGLFFIIVALLLALPAIIFGFVVNDFNQVRLKQGNQTDDTIAPSSAQFQVFLWFSWLTLNWLLAIALYAILSVVLYSIKSLFMFFNRKGWANFFQQLLNVRRYGTLVLSFCSMIVTFQLLFTANKNIPYQTIFLQVLYSLLFGSVLFFLEKIAIESIATNFHRTAYQDRIKENEWAVEVLEALKSSYSKNKNNTVDRGQTGIKSLVNLPLRKKSYVDLSSMTKVKKLAQSLYVALTEETGRDVVLEDFSPYFKTPESAKEAFMLFDKDNNGDISKQEMRNVVIGIYRERKAIAKSLRDLSHVVGKIDFTLTFVVLVLTALIGGLMNSSANPLTYIVPMGSIVVALSVAFGQPCRDFLESSIFLFVTHPYDSGDRVLIENMNLVVKEIGILTTVFVANDGQEYYIPNPKLRTMIIRNIRRSPCMADMIPIHISFNTPTFKIVELERKINSFLELHSRDYNTNTRVYLKEIQDVSKLTLTVKLDHKRNWQDLGQRMQRLHNFMIFLKETLTELEITYQPPPQEIRLPTQPVSMPMAMSMPRHSLDDSFSEIFASSSRQHY